MRKILLIAAVATYVSCADEAVQVSAIDEAFTAADTDKNDKISDAELKAYLNPQATQTEGRWTYYWNKVKHYSRKTFNAVTFNKFDKKGDGLDKNQFAQIYEQEIKKEIEAEEKEQPKQAQL